jgi:hypothetical protein
MDFSWRTIPILRYLAGAASGAFLVGLGCGIYLAAFNAVIGLGSRFALLVGTALMYGLVFAIPTAVVLVLLVVGRSVVVGPPLDRMTHPRFGALVSRSVLVLAVASLLERLTTVARAATTGGAVAEAIGHSMAPLAILLFAWAIAWLVSLLWRFNRPESRALKASCVAALLATLALGVAAAPAPLYRAPRQSTVVKREHVATTHLSAVDPRRVALIGFDGLDPVLLDTLLARNELPNLAELRERGFVVPLETLPIGFSPPIWATVGTGVQPTKHGMYDFVSRKVPVTDLDLSVLRAFPRGIGSRKLFELLPRTPLVKEELITPRDRDAPATWTLSSLAGIETCVVDWMASWPSERLLGTMISDRSFFAWNLGLLFVETGKRRIPRRLQGKETSLMEPDAVGGLCFPEPDCRRFLPERGLEDKIDPADAEDFHVAENLFYLEAAENLLSGHSCDYFVFYSHLPDFVNHTINADEHAAVLAGDSSMDGARLVLDTYREVDRTLGRLLPLLGEDRDILVVSDHGVGVVEQGDRKVVSHGFPAPAGVFVYAPPVGEEALQLDVEPTIYDIAPTAMALLGMPVTSDMRGDVLGLNAEIATGKAVFMMEASRLSSLLETGDAAATDADGMEEDLRERLKALGYIQ